MLHLRATLTQQKGEQEAADSNQLESRVHLHERLLLGRRLSLQDGIAVRKSAKLVNDHLVLHGELSALQQSTNTT